MKNTNCFTTCGKHGELGEDQVKKGGRMLNGNQRYRCLICSRDYQKRSYGFRKKESSAVHEHLKTFKETKWITTRTQQ